MSEKSPSQNCADRGTCLRRLRQMPSRSSTGPSNFDQSSPSGPISTRLRLKAHGGDGQPNFQKPGCFKPWRGRPPAILFSEFSSFHVGNKDLKPRTGSWRVALMLSTAVLVILVGGSILIWLGLVNPRDYWWVVTIALPFLLIGLAYLNLYKLPRRKAWNDKSKSSEVGFPLRKHLSPILFIFFLQCPIVRKDAETSSTKKD